MFSADARVCDPEVLFAAAAVPDFLAVETEAVLAPEELVLEADAVREAWAVFAGAVDFAAAVREAPAVLEADAVAVFEADAGGLPTGLFAVSPDLPDAAVLVVAPAVRVVLFFSGAGRADADLVVEDPVPDFLPDADALDAPAPFSLFEF